MAFAVGDWKSVARFLEGPWEGLRDSFGNNALHMAVAAGRADLVARLAEKIDPTGCNDLEVTPLETAVGLNRLAIFRELLGRSGGRLEKCLARLLNCSLQLDREAALHILLKRHYRGKKIYYCNQVQYFRVRVAGLELLGKHRRRGEHVAWPMKALAQAYHRDVIEWRD